jgi:methyl-accepting chemotaxis protein
MWFSNQKDREAGIQAQRDAQALKGELTAIGKTQAVAEFAPDGKLISANDNFLRALGYSIEDVRGQHHSMFVDPVERNSPDYRSFWERLSRGEHIAQQVRRQARDGRSVWLQARYTPVADEYGRVVKVLAHGTDVTTEVRANEQNNMLKQAVNVVSSAIMAVDRDFVVTYVNGTSMDMLRKYVDHFRVQWPGFDPEKILGMNIDTFHKNPAVQRRQLAEPSRLPHKAEIAVGPLRFSLHVHASYDSAGNYSGNILEWADVSDVRVKELQNAEFTGMFDAINKAQAVIEFAMDGKILNANDHFLRAMGYSLSELKGQHHSMFVDQVVRAGNDYRGFWDKLQRGELEAGEFRRVSKSGHEVFLLGSYNPIVGPDGKPFKVVLYATDVTKDVLARNQANIMKEGMNIVASAIMMVDRDFIVTYANETSMDLLRRYTEDFRALWPNFNPDKIIGMCIDTFHKNPAHQRRQLDDPSRLPIHTEITVGRLRFALHVHASYDAQGKYCGNMLEWADVTDVRLKELQNAEFTGMFDAINKAQAVIEFSMDGKILNANDNFLSALGYTLPEIKGQHHSMFVDPTTRQSQDYRMFWDKLGRGEYDSGQYKRIGKAGREVWIQASYNPIIGPDGKPFKVIKYATDITEQVRNSQALQLAVNQSQEVIEAAKSQDLSSRVPLEGKTGEIAKLCGGINELLDTMTDVISSILDTSSTVTNAVSEITTGTSDLSQRTEQQASNLEETAASMEQMAATIKLNADNAQQANQHAINATSVATEGGEVVGKAVEAMSLIESSSQKISDIIGVIDEIAFQTNLLALNAAVEAARAGDAGKGFAVVASEVRSLAQRSSGAAKDIKALIAASGSQVKDGVKLVNNAGVALNEIVNSIKRVADIVSDIALASKEQATSVEEINRAVSHMDEMTQQNSALVEENAAACRMLQQQAQEMQDRMSEFALDGTTGGPARPVHIEKARRAGGIVTPKLAKPAGKGAPQRKLAAPAQRGAAGMQAALQSSLGSDADWKEF